MLRALTMAPRNDESSRVDSLPLAHDLFFDWNPAVREAWPAVPRLVDETLRDGLQSPSAHDPPLSKKLELLHAMAGLGIDCAALGYPASRPRQFEDALALTREIARARLAIEPCCAARMLEADVRPIVEIAERAGVPVQVGLFIGSSPIRQRIEGWDIDHLLRLTESAVRFAVGHGLSVLFITEDTTRARPDTLERLYAAAIRQGARRVGIADTVGHATPEGARALVEFVRGVSARVDPSVGIDWHGHRDRGLALACSLAAWSGGAERCHGTALGIGERSGNTPIELLLLNLVLLGRRRVHLGLLPNYVRLAASALGFSVPPHQPVVGRDAFRTATGTHAAAIVRAEAGLQPALAEHVYSSVPSTLVGREQVIDLGPLSGEANVRHLLLRSGSPVEDALVARVLEAAKHRDAVLDETAALELIRELTERVSAPSDER